MQPGLAAAWVLSGVCQQAINSKKPSSPPVLLEANKYIGDGDADNCKDYYNISISYQLIIL